MSTQKFDNFQLTPLFEGKVGHLEITAKTVKIAYFDEIKEVFRQLKKWEDLRCVVITSVNKHFTTGLDLMDATGTLSTDPDADVGRQGIKFIRIIESWQASMATLQELDVPVIVGVDSYCIGAGIDLISHADIRYCTKTAKFTIKEIDIGMCADIGAIQRLPLICKNDGKLRELMYTGRIFGAQEAKEIGFVSEVFEDKKIMTQKVMELAEQIASKSPVAVYTIKNVMNHQQLQQQQSNLRYQKVVNTGMLQTQDMKIAIMAGMQKQKPVFPKL